MIDRFRTRVAALLVEAARRADFEKTRTRPQYHQRLVQRDLVYVDDVLLRLRQRGSATDDSGQRFYVNTRGEKVIVP